MGTDELAETRFRVIQAFRALQGKREEKLRPGMETSLCKGEKERRGTGKENGLKSWKRRASGWESQSF